MRQRPSLQGAYPCQEKVINSQSKKEMETFIEANYNPGDSLSESSEDCSAHQRSKHCNISF